MEIPTIFTQPENFYSLACYTYILSGVICAVVRWFHMCRPFDQRSDYFYPARRQVTFFYAATALQLPYMLCPGDPGSWFFARSFGILYYPVCFALLYHRFFQMRHLWSKKLSIAYFCSPFLLLGALFIIVVFHQNDLLLPYKRLWECIMVCVSILLTYRLVKECRWVAKKVESYHTQNYSNESDFPFTFAKSMLYLPAVWLIVMWALFLLDNQMVKAFIDLIMAAWHVLLLCHILHPSRPVSSKRNMDDMKTIENENMERILQENELLEKVVEATDNLILEEPCTEDEAGVTDETGVADEAGVTDENNETDEANERQLIERNGENTRQRIEKEKWESVKNEVLTIVSHRYLEPSLKRIEVIRDVSAMNHTLAGTFITQVGSYRLVNAFRVRHYERLMESDSTSNLGQEIAAEMCGFKNRWGLANARKRLKDFDYELIERYVR
uniref:hypothetical protein n=1 Tax=Prevotella sp. TaxID=59823 RepID=UPI004025A23F